MLKSFLKQVAFFLGYFRLCSVHHRGVELETRKPVILVSWMMDRFVGVPETEDLALFSSSHIGSEGSARSFCILEISVRKTGCGVLS